MFTDDDVGFTDSTKCCGKFLPTVTLHSRNANVAAITTRLAIGSGRLPEPAVIVGSYDRWGKFLPTVTLHSRNCVANVAAITIVVWLAIDAMQGGWPEPAVIVGSYDRFQVGPGHNDFIKHIRRL